MRRFMWIAIVGSSLFGLSALATPLPAGTDTPKDQGTKATVADESNRDESPSPDLIEGKETPETAKPNESETQTETPSDLPPAPPKPQLGANSGSSPSGGAPVRARANTRSVRVNLLITAHVLSGCVVQVATSADDNLSMRCTKDATPPKREHSLYSMSMARAKRQTRADGLGLDTPGYDIIHF